MLKCPQKQKYKILLASCALCFLFIITITLNVQNFEFGYIQLSTQIVSDAIQEFIKIRTKEPDRSKLLLDYCHLPNLNPWDPVLEEHLDPKYNPLESCKVNFKKLTKVINNTIFLQSKLNNAICGYSCILRKNDDENINGHWKSLTNGTKPLCDIVQVKCYDAANRTVIYEYLHALIYRNENLLPKPESPDMPNVHVILLDSVSSSQFERTMNKTAKYLRTGLQATRMKYLNKIGLNSLPNAYVLLLGKASEPIPDSPISIGYPSDWETEPCYQYLDNDQFIGFRYRDAGYVTYMADDWYDGIFIWPDCVGFKNKPMDHYMRPYQNYYYDKEIDKILHKKQCKEHTHDVVEHFQTFLNTYPDRPTFSVLWFTDMAHDDFNGPYHMDKYFYKFFKKNKKYWDNSYVIVMADHGNRFQPARETWVGETEDNNPMLYISVPKNRRIPEVLDQLEENSNKLITHYDIYATLVNLVHPKNPTHQNLTIYGEDLFGPLREPRTCDRLRIPMQYCLCDFNKTLLPQNDQTAITIANACVEKINQDLENHPETKTNCARLKIDTYNNTVTAESYFTNGSDTILRVSWFTTPGTGEFSGIAIRKKNGTVIIISTKFPRSNAYSSEAQCVEHSLIRPYCFCNN